MKIIGLDLGGTKISAGLVDGGRLIKQLSEPTDRHGSTAVVEQIKAIIARLMSKDVKAIGIGVPSIVETETGTVFEVTNIKGWKRVALGEILRREFKIPVYVNNDANCFVLGEKYFGQAKKYQDIVGLTLGTGMGAGIIIRGKIYNGRNCGAGEFCNIPYLDHNLEYYASGNFFSAVHKTSGSKLYEAAVKGDKKARKIFAEFGEHAGAALAIAALSVDPQIIVIGGSVAQAYPFYQDAMQRSLKAKVYRQTYANLKIAVSQSKHSAVLGAASLCLDARSK